MAIRLGIAIPTYGNSAIRLDALLSSLDKFTVHGRNDMTILVSDDGTHNGDFIAEQKMVCKKWNVGHIHRDDWGHIAGNFDDLGHKMNVEIIMYLADDTVVSYDWFRAIDYVYTQNPSLKIGMVSPTYIEAWELALNDILAHEYRFYDPTKWKKEATADCEWNTGRIMRNDLYWDQLKYGQYFKEGRIKQPDYTPVLGVATDGRCHLREPWPMDGGIGPCFSIRRDVFLEVDGFKDMPSGDFECLIGWQAWDAGYLCCCIYSPPVMHARCYASAECDQVMDPMNSPGLRKFRWGTPESFEWFKEHHAHGIDLTGLPSNRYFPTVQRQYIDKYCINEENHEKLRQARWLRYDGCNPTIYTHYKRLDEIAAPGPDYGDERQRERVSWIANHTQTQSALDLGCGDGYVLASLPPGDYAGIDIDRERIDAAMKRMPQYPFYVMDVTYGIPDSCGRKTVIIADVLEHLRFDNAIKLVLRAWELAGENLVITLPWDDDMAINIDHKWRPNEAYVSKICCALQTRPDCGPVVSERKFGFSLLNFKKAKG